MESHPVTLRVVPGPAAKIRFRSSAGVDPLPFVTLDQNGALVVHSLAVEVVDGLSNLAAVSSDNTPLSITLRPVLVPHCQGAEELTLEGGDPVLLTAQTNPVTFEGLRIVGPRRIQECEVFLGLEVKMEEGVVIEGSDALQAKFTYTDDEVKQSRDRRREQLSVQEAQMKFDLDARKERLAELEDKLAEQSGGDAEGAAARKVSEAEEQIVTLRDEFSRREDSERAEAAVHNVRIEGLRGVVGALAALGVIDRCEGIDASAVQAAVSSAARGLLSSVLFASDDALQEFDNLPQEAKKQSRIPRLYSSESMPPAPKAAPKIGKVPGFLAFASEVVKVHERVPREHQSAARQMLDRTTRSLMLFETFSEANAYFKAMSAAGKSCPGRLVGLDRPGDLLDTDGGRNVQLSEDARSLPRLGIIAFSASERGDALRAKIEAAEGGAATARREEDEVRQVRADRDHEREEVAGREQSLATLQDELLALT